MELRWEDGINKTTRTKEFRAYRGKVLLFYISHNPLTHRGDPTGKSDKTPWRLSTTLPQVKQGEKYGTPARAKDVAQRRFDKWMEGVSS